MTTKGHSAGNGHQQKMLLREMQILRGAQNDMNAKIDRAVALADRPLGMSAASRLPIQYPIGLPARPASEGARGTPSGFGDAGVTAPLRPAAAPIPGALNISAAKGELDATYGVSGTPITSGFLLDLGEYNPELMGRNAIPTYEKMRRSDGQVRATLMACKLPILSAKWEVMAAPEIQNSELRNQKKASTGAGSATQAKAKEIAEFVKDNLLGGLEFQSSSGGWVSQTWQSVISNALLMLDFGCAIHEDVWAVDGAKIRLRSLPSRLPLTFYRWHTEADGETLLALEQYGYRGNQFLNALLPADKIARFTYQQEGANFWGIPLQRAMYPHWYIKSKLYRLDAIANERNSLGVPVFRLAPGFNGQDKEAAYSFVTQLATHEATGLVEPPGDATTGLRIVGYQGRLRDVLPSIQHHNEMISRAALNTFMDLGQSAHGSRALGATATDFFMLGLQSVADQIALDITQSTIRRLVSLNFGDDAPCPRLLAGNVQARSVADMTGDLVSLAQYGLVVSENNLRKHIREKLALPEESDRGIVAIKGETIDTGTLGAAVSGRSTGAVENAAQKPAGTVGAKSATQTAAGNQQMSEGVARRRTQVSQFWRNDHDPKLKMVSPHEAHIDFPSLQAAYARGERQVTNVLAAAKSKLVRAYSAKMAKSLKGGQDPATITFAPSAELRASLRAETQRVYDFGADQVKQERDRVTAMPRQAKLLADSPGAAKKRYQLIADIAASDVETDVSNATRKSANDLRRDPDLDDMGAGEVADQLFGSVSGTGYVDDGIAKAGREAARSAMAAGRNDALVQGRAQLERVGGYYERTGMLDENECDNCADHDGEVRPASLGVPPETTSDGICEGGAACRCDWFEVMA